MRVQSNCSGVRIKCIPILIDLVIKDANRAPKGGIPSVSIYSLLIGFVGFGVLLQRHVAAAQKIPTLCILVVWAIVSITERCIEHASTDPSLLISPNTRLLALGWHNGGFLDGVTIPAAARPWHGLGLAPVHGDRRVWRHHTTIKISVCLDKSCIRVEITYVLLLLVNVANLEPNIFFGQRPRGILDYILEALAVCQRCIGSTIETGAYFQALCIFLLLLVD